LSDKPKILLISDSSDGAEQLFGGANDSHEIVVVQNPMRALALMGREKFAGVFVAAKYCEQAFDIGKLLQNEQILEGMPDGVALLESDNTIVWGNGRIREWSGRESVAGLNFYAALGGPEILGPDFCPFHTALATSQSTSSTLRSQDNRYFHVHAAPVQETEGPPRHLIITIREVTG
jgi:two-component system, sensor histidine kinase SagS